MTLHILIASHACSAPQNQTLFKLAAEQRDWKVTMVLPQEWLNEYGEQTAAKMLDGFNADLVTFPVVRSGSVPLHGYWGRLTALLRRRRPDVVYAHNEAYSVSAAQWCYAAKRARTRTFGFFSCQNIRKTYPPPFRWTESWVYRHSQIFFPITEAVLDVHQSKGYDGPATIVPLGFDTDKFRRATTEENGSEEQHPCRILYVGRIVEEKGLITMARALGRLRHLSWQWHLVGGGPYESVLRRELETQKIDDRVHWRGFVDRDEMPSIYSSMDITVIPSETRANWKEQFGRVILESLACGTAVLGSDSGEIPVLIRQTGGGSVFREANKEDCAVQLAAMIENADERERMAAVGHQVAHANFTLERASTVFADAIERAHQGAST